MLIRRKTPNKQTNKPWAQSCCYLLWMSHDHSTPWFIGLFNPYPNKFLCLCVCCTSVLKTPWEKEKLLVTSNFSFSLSVFLPFWRTHCHFYRIKNCRLQTLSVWKSLNFVVWERVIKIPFNGFRITWLLDWRGTKPPSAKECLAQKLRNVIIKLGHEFYIVK